MKGYDDAYPEKCQNRCFTQVSKGSLASEKNRETQSCDQNAPPNDIQGLHLDQHTQDRRKSKEDDCKMQQDVRQLLFGPLHRIKKNKKTGK